MSSNPFPKAAGFGNFPNGNFSPDIFAKEGLYYLRQLSVVDDITISDYQGEITKQGDTVHIRKQPKVTVREYKRGTKLKTQNLEDDKTTLVIDSGNYYQFEIDDVMVAQSDQDYEAMAAESAAYEIRDAYDRAILANIFAAVKSTNVVGVSGTEKTIGYGSGNDFTPMDALSRLNRILTENNVPNTGRWAVASPEFIEALSREAGILNSADRLGGGSALLRDKGVLNRPIHNFTMFETNNAPVNANDKPVLLVGHVSAYATAQQLTNNEVLRNPDDFGNIHRGLHVFGDTCLRDTALACMHMNIGDV